jgi:DNA-binding NarL/FixJ family response regulator
VGAGFEAAAAAGQVALTIAKGATNREAAAALFLSLKTIEFHLANIYRKLGLRSRSELTRNILETGRPTHEQAAPRHA